MDKVRVGVVGCGAISGAYLKHAQLYPELLEVAACADINPEAARKRAEEFHIPRVCQVEELLREKSIEIVLNLTIPAAHAAVALAAIRRGKHTYSEKPFATTVAEGRKVLAAAAKKGVRVGCAPDTFFGAGHQTARKLIDDGAIGRPLAAIATWLSRGHESWHPNPEFYYKPGGGPMFDMGPYYLTALVNMLGPVRRVHGSAGVLIPERTITHRHRQTGEPGPKFGQKITVETPDHVTGTLEFASGAIGTISTSFACGMSPYEGRWPITVFGTDGTLRVPDPNGFDGSVQLRRNGEAEFAEVPHTHGTGFARMAGVADLALAIRHHRPQRASGDLAFAVLEMMEGFIKSSGRGKAVEVRTQPERPAPLPTSAKPGSLAG